MGSKKRIALAVVVMLAGLGVALCFRQPIEPHDTPAATASEQPSRDDRAAVASGNSGLSRYIADSPAGAAGQEGNRLQVSRPFAPAANDDVEGPSSARPAQPAMRNVDAAEDRLALGPEPPEVPQRTHIIRDGDTLTYLAEKYLGSAERYLEIYAANRDLLRSPDLLPIGVELKIPPRGVVPPPQPRETAIPAAAPTAAPSDKLVPIPPGSLRRQR